MDNKTSITVALANINSTIEVLKDNAEFNIIQSNLNTVKIILEGQLTPNNPTIRKPFKAGGVKTYTVQEDTTEGWTDYEDQNKDKTSNLSKEQAKELIDELINDGVNPDRLRVVVDGQV